MISSSGAVRHVTLHRARKLTYFGIHDGIGREPLWLKVHPQSTCYTQRLANYVAHANRMQCITTVFQYPVPQHNPEDVLNEWAELPTSNAPANIRTPSALAIFALCGLGGVLHAPPKGQQAATGGGQPLSARILTPDNQANRSIILSDGVRLPRGGVRSRGSSVGDALSVSPSRAQDAISHEEFVGQQSVVSGARSRSRSRTQSEWNPRRGRETSQSDRSGIESDCSDVDRGESVSYAPSLVAQRSTRPMTQESTSIEDATHSESTSFQQLNKVLKDETATVYDLLRALPTNTECIAGHIRSWYDNLQEITEQYRIDCEDLSERIKQNSDNQTKKAAEREYHAKCCIKELDGEIKSLQEDKQGLQRDFEDLEEKTKSLQAGKQRLQCDLKDLKEKTTVTESSIDELPQGVGEIEDDEHSNAEMRAMKTTLTSRSVARIFSKSPQQPEGMTVLASGSAMSATRTVTAHSRFSTHFGAATGSSCDAESSAEIDIAQIDIAALLQELYEISTIPKAAVDAISAKCDELQKEQSDLCDKYSKLNEEYKRDMESSGRQGGVSRALQALLDSVKQKTGARDVLTTEVRRLKKRHNKKSQANKELEEYLCELQAMKRAKEESAAEAELEEYLRNLARGGRTLDDSLARELETQSESGAMVPQPTECALAGIGMRGLKSSADSEFPDDSSVDVVSDGARTNGDEVMGLEPATQLPAEDPNNGKIPVVNSAVGHAQPNGGVVTHFAMSDASGHSRATSHSATEPSLEGVYDRARWTPRAPMLVNMSETDGKASADRRYSIEAVFANNREDMARGLQLSAMRDILKLEQNSRNSLYAFDGTIQSQQLQNAQQLFALCNEDLSRDMSALNKIKRSVELSRRELVGANMQESKLLDTEIKELQSTAIKRLEVESDEEYKSRCDTQAEESRQTTSANKARQYDLHKQILEWHHETLPADHDDLKERAHALWCVNRFEELDEKLRKAQEGGEQQQIIAQQREVCKEAGRAITPNASVEKMRESMNELKFANKVLGVWRRYKRGGSVNPRGRSGHSQQMSGMRSARSALRSRAQSAGARGRSVVFGSNHDEERYIPQHSAATTPRADDGSVLQCDPSDGSVRGRSGLFSRGVSNRSSTSRESSAGSNITGTAGSVRSLRSQFEDMVCESSVPRARAGSTVSQTSARNSRKSIEASAALSVLDARVTALLGDKRAPGYYTDIEKCRTDILNIIASHCADDNRRDVMRARTPDEIGRMMQYAGQTLPENVRRNIVSLAEKLQKELDKKPLTFNHNEIKVLGELAGQEAQTAAEAQQGRLQSEVDGGRQAQQDQERQLADARRGHEESERPAEEARAESQILAERLQAKVDGGRQAQQDQERQLADARRGHEESERPAEEARAESQILAERLQAKVGELECQLAERLADAERARHTEQEVQNEAERIKNAEQGAEVLVQQLQQQLESSQDEAKQRAAEVESAEQSAQEHAEMLASERKRVEELEHAKNEVAKHVAAQAEELERANADAEKHAQEHVEELERTKTDAEKRAQKHVAELECIKDEAGMREQAHANRLAEESERAKQELEDLRQKLASKAQEASEMAQSLEQARRGADERAQELEAERQKAEQQLRGLESKSQESNKELEQVRESGAERAQELEALRQALGNKAIEFEGQENEAAELRNKLSAAEGRATESAAKLQETEEAVVCRAKIEEAAAQRDHEKVQKRIKELEQQVESNKHEADAALGKHREALDVGGQARDRIQALEAELVDAESRAHQERQVATDAAKEAQAAKQQAEEAQEQNAELEKGCAEKAQDLRKQLEAAENESNKAQAKNTELENECAKQFADLRKQIEAQEQNAKLEKERAKQTEYLRQQLEKVEADAQAQKDAADAKQHELASELEGERQARSEAAESSDGLGRELSEAYRTHGSRHGELERQLAEVNEASREHQANFKNAGDQAEELRARLAELERNLAEEREAVQRAQSEASELASIHQVQQSELAESQGERDVLQGKLEDAESANQATAERQARDVAALDRHRKEEEALQGRVAELEQRVHAAAEQSEKSAERLRESNESACENREESEELQRRIAELGRELNKAETQAGDKQRALQESEEMAQSSASELDRLRQQLNEAAQDKDQRISNEEELTRQLARLEQQQASQAEELGDASKNAANQVVVLDRLREELEGAHQAQEARAVQDQEYKERAENEQNELKKQLEAQDKLREELSETRAQQAEDADRVRAEREELQRQLEESREQQAQSAEEDKARNAEIQNQLRAELEAAQQAEAAELQKHREDSVRREQDVEGASHQKAEDHARASAERNELAAMKEALVRVQEELAAESQAKQSAERERDRANEDAQKERDAAELQAQRDAKRVSDAERQERDAKAIAARYAEDTEARMRHAEEGAAKRVQDAEDRAQRAEESIVQARNAEERSHASAEQAVHELNERLRGVESEAEIRAKELEAAQARQLAEERARHAEDKERVRKAEEEVERLRRQLEDAQSMAPLPRRSSRDHIVEESALSGGSDAAGSDRRRVSSASTGSDQDGSPVSGDTLQLTKPGDISGLLSLPDPERELSGLFAENFDEQIVDGLIPPGDDSYLRSLPDQSNLGGRSGATSEGSVGRDGRRGSSASAISGLGRLLEGGNESPLLELPEADVHGAARNADASTQTYGEQPEHAAENPSLQSEHATENLGPQSEHATENLGPQSEHAAENPSLQSEHAAENLGPQSESSVQHDHSPGVAQSDLSHRECEQREWILRGELHEARRANDAHSQDEYGRGVADEKLRNQAQEIERLTQELQKMHDSVSRPNENGAQLAKAGDSGDVAQSLSPSDLHPKQQGAEGGESQYSRAAVGVLEKVAVTDDGDGSPQGVVGEARGSKKQQRDDDVASGGASAKPIPVERGLSDNDRDELLAQIRKLKEEKQALQEENAQVAGCAEKLETEVAEIWRWVKGLGERVGTLQQEQGLLPDDSDDSDTSSTRLQRSLPSSDKEGVIGEVCQTLLEFANRIDSTGPTSGSNTAASKPCDRGSITGGDIDSRDRKLTQSGDEALLDGVTHVDSLTAVAHDDIDRAPRGSIDGIDDLAEGVGADDLSMGLGAASPPDDDAGGLPHSVAQQSVPEAGISVLDDISGVQRGGKCAHDARRSSSAQVTKSSEGASGDAGASGARAVVYAQARGPAPPSGSLEGVPRSSGRAMDESSSLQVGGATGPVQHDEAQIAAPDESLTNLGLPKIDDPTKSVVPQDRSTEIPAPQVSTSIEARYSAYDQRGPDSTCHNVTRESSTALHSTGGPYHGNGSMYEGGDGLTSEPGIAGALIMHDDGDTPRPQGVPQGGVRTHSYTIVLESGEDGGVPKSTEPVSADSSTAVLQRGVGGSLRQHSGALPQTAMPSGEASKPGVAGNISQRNDAQAEESNKPTSSSDPASQGNVRSTIHASDQSTSGEGVVQQGDTLGAENERSTQQRGSHRTTNTSPNNVAQQAGGTPKSGADRSNEQPARASGQSAPHDSAAQSTVSGDRTETIGRESRQDPASATQTDDARPGDTGGASVTSPAWMSSAKGAQLIAATQSYPAAGQTPRESQPTLAPLLWHSSQGGAGVSYSSSDRAPSQIGAASGASPHISDDTGTFVHQHASSTDQVGGMPVAAYGSSGDAGYLDVSGDAGTGSVGGRLDVAGRVSTSEAEDSASESASYESGAGRGVVHQQVVAKVQSADTASAPSTGFGASAPNPGSGNGVGSELRGIEQVVEGGRLGSNGGSSGKSRGGSSATSNRTARSEMISSSIGGKRKGEDQDEGRQQKGSQWNDNSQKREGNKDKNKSSKNGPSHGNKVRFRRHNNSLRRLRRN